MSNYGYSKNEFQSKLNAEFQKIDNFYKEFKSDFSVQLSKVLKEQFTQTLFHEKLDELIIQYSIQIFNTAESVSDKDKHYSSARMTEELEAMTRVVKRNRKISFETGLAEHSHKKAKEVMVNHFPKLIDLSSGGFRLLEKYCLICNQEFVHGFYKLSPNLK